MTVREVFRNDAPSVVPDIAQRLNVIGPAGSLLKVTLPLTEALRFSTELAASPPNWTMTFEPGPTWLPPLGVYP